ncbi:DUF6003 family protein [Streptomyces sp. ODS05-4]|uniref:DUF6003 family protein n=1 Tax=Streptomyces sp. ODS05-4 TaxID=2944939 RepID=UPI002108DD5C|nr:DUF6003 family protein [Streptomyces sp. ODS05-4]
MTDDAYLYLSDGRVTTGAPGVPLSAVGGLECLETSAVQAWFGAQGVAADSPALRLVVPEETPAIPEEAERLPVPLTGEELARARQAAVSGVRSSVEAELMAYQNCAGDRDELLRRAVASGLPAHRIAELTGLDPATVAAAAGAR